MTVYENLRGRFNEVNNDQNKKLRKLVDDKEEVGNKKKKKKKVFLIKFCLKKIIVSWTCMHPCMLCCFYLQLRIKI